MLHVFITHYDKVICVERIERDGTVVAERQLDTNMIDFSVCEPFIGKDIQVSHRFVNHEKEDYTMDAKLIAIDTDEHGIKSIRYQTGGLRKE